MTIEGTTRDAPKAAALIGRRAELGALTGALDASFAGQGQLVLLAGEPGIGKTRLATAVAADAQARHALVLWGRCWEGGGSPPYWPWVQVMREYIRSRDADALAAEVGSGAAYLAQVVPELRERLTVTPAELDLESEEARFALLDATAGLLRNASAAQPVVVIVDDLHAADRPSLVLLRFLAGELRQSRVLLIAAYREVEARLTPGVGELLGELLGQSANLQIGGLSEPEIEQLVADTSSGERSAEELAHVHEVAAGNPFFAVETVRLLESQGVGALPTAVRETVARRLALLAPATQRVLQVASVIGKELEIGVLERALNAPVDLGEAIGARLVTEESGRYAFTHALVRETLYDALGRGERAQLHLEVAAALEELAPADPGEQLSALAHHCLEAASIGGRERGIEYSERAGDRAATMLAFEEAAEHYQRALSASGPGRAAAQRCDLLLKLGETQWKSGDAAASQQTFLAAAETARQAADPERLARSALGFGHWFLFRFRVDEAVIALLEEALDGLGQDETALRALVMARLALEMLMLPQHERRDWLSAEAVRIARAAGDRAALFTTLYSRNWCTSRPDTLAERLASADELLAIATDAGDREMVFLARHARLICLLEYADQRAANKELVMALQVAEQLRQPFYVWRATILRAVLAMQEARLSDAERLAAEAYAVARDRYADVDEIIYRQMHLLSIRFYQGRVDEMEEETREMVARHPWWPRWRQPLLAAALGRVGEAQAELGRHQADFADLRDRRGSGGYVWALHLSALAQACVLTGNTARAAALYEQLLGVADRSAMTLSEIGYGPVSWRLGMLATLLHRWDEAERHFEDALESVALSGTEHFAAQILLEQARMLVARGDDGERARDLVARALEISVRLELPGIADRARAMGKLLGAAPDVLRREGEYWTIAFGGATCRLKDSKGLGYIATLLASPGREIHVLELAAEGTPTPDRGDAGEVIDDSARDAYRARLGELAAELEEAQSFNDPERAARTQVQIDALTSELAAAVGLGGRARRAASPAERARVSVTKRIRSAIEKVGENDAALAEHLGAAIRTGTFCSYQPGADGPRWSVY